MRSLCALYVDAGYLLASAATRVTGTSLLRGVSIDHRRLIEGLIGQATADSELQLLRVNWYDSGGQPGGVPDRTQEAIGDLPRVKLRLGRLSAYGEQKGVDLRLGLDLVTHARNRAVDLIYLVTGDDDLTEAVEEVQGHGIQVIVMAVPNTSGAPQSVSRHLQREADRVLVIEPAIIDEAVRPAPVRAVPERASEAVPTPAILARLHPLRPRPTEPVGAAARESPLVYSSETGGAPSEQRVVHEVADQVLDDVSSAVLETWVSRATESDRKELLQSKPYIPGDVDRALLMDLSDRIGQYYIDELLRIRLRGRFWVKAEGLLAESDVDGQAASTGRAPE